MNNNNNMNNENIIDLLTEDDLDDVLAIQRSVYIDDLLEDKTTFVAMLLAYPTGCFALRKSGRLLAYFFTHPGNNQMLPPSLNSKEHTANETPNDLYYFHDLAVHKDAHNIGAGTRLLYKAVMAARDGGFDRFALTAVQEAEHFWTRFGFSVVAQETLDAAARKRLTSYASNPLVMIASYDNIMTALTPRVIALGLSTL